MIRATAHQVALSRKLTQGILWVDKNVFQIIRMRSDLPCRTRKFD
jgi:hypothetical protein